MQSRPSDRILVTTLALILVSCGGDSRESSEEIHSSLVFEARSVSSSRNHLLVASAAQPGSKERQLDAFLALYSLPTGVVYSPQHHRPTSNCSANIEKGSGWLTSSSRLVTAHHVTYPLSQDAARYEVRFGGSAPALTAEGSGGRWLADADANQYPYDDPNWPALSAVDDNPLVSNRIFQLGMDPWARPGAFGEEARDELEAWEFVIDGNSTGNDFAHQGIMSYTVDPQTGSPQLFGRDIAVLRADGLLEYQELGELEPMFGTFDFTSPAVFFDSLDPRVIERTEHPFDEHTPLQLLHAPHYPYPAANYLTQIWAPMISRHGRFLSGRGPNFQPLCWDDGAGWDVSSDSYFVPQGLYDTTLDIVAGSSGGGMLSCATAASEELANGRRSCPPRVDGAVVEGSYIDPPRVKGVAAQIWTPGGGSFEHLDWAEPVSTSSGYASVMTAIDSQADKWAGRDVGNPANPFSPRFARYPGETGPACISSEFLSPPIDCGDDEDCPSGTFCSMNLCAECTSWSPEPAPNRFGTPEPRNVVWEGPDEGEDDGEDLFSSDPDYPAANEFHVQEVDCGNLIRHRDTARQPLSCANDNDCPQTTCGSDGLCEDDGHSGAGVMIGIRGATVDWDGDPEGMAVGGIQPVCAPWTGRSWTDNWQFLMSLGAHNKPGVDSRGYGPGVGAPFLHDRTVREFERRVSNEGVHVWPKSMKLCPPNYFMVGMKTRTENNVGEPGIVRGVTHLVCEHSVWNTDAATPIIEVPLLQPKDWTQLGGWSLGDHEVMVTQYIGYPDPAESPAPTAVDGCDSDEAWAGIRTKHDNSGRLVAIWPLCVEKP